jgi:hypothetical protein
MEGIQPKPGKLWERTQHWTLEDATLGGGALGIFMTLNPRALPGVRGFARFFGAATVGCALGFKAGQAFVVRLPPPLIQLFDQTMTGFQQKEYQKLHDNDKAKASLSRIGKLALWYHTSQVMGLLRNPLQVGGMGGMGRISGGPTQPVQSSPLAALKAEMDRDTVIQVEFKEGELAGPDVENGFRAYQDDLKSRDASKIQDWLEYVKDLKEKTGAELQYVSGHLAQREHEFYRHVEEDREKDILRRELQLLNSMAADSVTRHAILGYHEQDAQKQLKQIEQAESSARLDAVSQTITTSHETPHHLAEVAQVNHYGPHLITERIRTTWSRQKELLRHLEQAISRGSSLESEGGTVIVERTKHLERDAEQMRKNVEATERLLRWFEERVREASEASEEVKDSDRQNGA